MCKYHILENMVIHKNTCHCLCCAQKILNVYLTCANVFFKGPLRLCEARSKQRSCSQARFAPGELSLEFIRLR